jgi:hypothetical protein
MHPERATDRAIPKMIGFSIAFFSIAFASEILPAAAFGACRYRGKGTDGRSSAP